MLHTLRYVVSIRGVLWDVFYLSSARAVAGKACAASLEYDVMVEGERITVDPAQLTYGALSCCLAPSHVVIGAWRWGQAEAASVAKGFAQEFHPRLGKARAVPGGTVHCQGGLCKQV